MQIYETTGGKFDTSTPPGQGTVAVGSGTMTFQSCSAATFKSRPDGREQHGFIGNHRLAALVRPRQAALNNANCVRTCPQLLGLVAVWGLPDALASSMAGYRKFPLQPRTEGDWPIGALGVAILRMGKMKSDSRRSCVTAETTEMKRWRKRCNQVHRREDGCKPFCWTVNGEHPSS